MQTPAETRALTIRWPAALHDQLRQIAERHDRSVTAEVRIAVREHLERSTEQTTTPASEDTC
jgi:predicted transcriptional regulator